ncbi:biotin carboxylase N-terminal domain-containing protein [Primorskyibacter sp. S187A]|uniref:acetyl/propionyl/methylcrotonyl-CoA carboxylase subunit alpha n=1 Tax=Primorskyibacter sp. S187A TaxID=3415130 RepID=UPI003C7D56A4
MIRKLLIANRGEIAVRIVRTCRTLGIATVAVYSDADERALHVERADEAVRIGPAPVSESYLKVDAILDAAKATGADAIHPGYGFLSENPDFVEAVEAAGLIFIGPTAWAIRAMGLKDKAKALMEKAGVPVVPGYHGTAQDAGTLAREARRIGYPVLIKARAGGGGKGMRLVERPEDFGAALEGAQREGAASFGDPVCLIEKFITAPRHIEIQIFGDADGNVVHLFERDCSLQRRHQKVIEEAPAPGMTDEVRAAMGAAAVAAAKAVDYRGAGTVEFIADGSGPLRTDGFWFMEMNTRLQVEHPVTEAITGVDLVALQFSVAQGAPLPFAQEELSITGHAFEARLYAEDVPAGFLPATGQLAHLSFGEARIDTGVRTGDSVSPFYDPMIAKIICHGPDRPAALRQLERALEETQVVGCTTNRRFLQKLAQNAAFGAGHVDTGLIERHAETLVPASETSNLALVLAALAYAQPQKPDDIAGFRHFGPARRDVSFAEPSVTISLAQDPSGTVTANLPEGEIVLENVTLDGTQVRFTHDTARKSAFILRHQDTLFLQYEAEEFVFQHLVPGASALESASDSVTSPMPGRIIKLDAKAGQQVSKGQALLVLEAMKMEHTLTAPRDGVIAEVSVERDDQVEQGARLIDLTPE